jgi:hypothetical protein
LLLARQLACHHRRHTEKQYSQVAVAAQDLGSSQKGVVQVIDTTGVQRLLVVASRGWPCTRVVRLALKASYRPGITLVVGDTRGVDTYAARTWRSFGGEVEVHEADWNIFPGTAVQARRARNEWMCHSLMPERDLALAFVYNASAVTTHCLAYAQEWGIATLVWRTSDPVGLGESALHVHA